MDQKIVFGRRVKKLREKLGLTQDQLAFKSELDRTYVNRIESGATNPSLLVIYDLAKALEVHPAYLMFSSKELRENPQIEKLFNY